MAKGYIIVHTKVKDPEHYKDYVEQVNTLLRKAGAVFIVRGGEATQFEGKEVGPRHAIIEYPSYEEALKSYNSEEYQKIAKLRHASSESELIIVEGV